MLDSIAMLDALRRSIARHAPATAEAGIAGTIPPGVRLATSDVISEPNCDTLEPTFALVVSGAKRTVLGETAFAYEAGQYLVAGADLPVTGAITQAPFAAFVLRLEPAAIAALLLQASDGRPPSGPECALAVSDAGPALLDAVGRMLGLLDHPADAAVLAPLYEREILWRLIAGPQGAMIRRIGLADSSLAHIGRAIAWLRSNYRRAIRVEELAALSAMSVSSFHRHFRAVTRMTPLQYQQHLRLHEARALLSTRAHDVAGVGYAVGYESPSQFSREYRRMFGAPPGRDSARLTRRSSRTSPSV